MKKWISILIVFVVLSSGCSSSSDDYVDPIAEFKTVCQDLSLLTQHQPIVIVNGREDASDTTAYDKAFRDFYFSQPYLIDTFNNVITFQIMTFVNNIYTNREGMTINVANDEYVFDSEETITIEGSLENTSVQLTYNPERETWVFIGKRGGVVNGNSSEEEPTDVWIKQEGAIVSRTTYYVSTIFYYAEDSGGTKYTTSSILTYGTSEFPALKMAGQNESCQTYCINTDYTQIFSNGITSGWEDWDDFKYYPSQSGGTVDYEISVN